MRSLRSLMYQYLERDLLSFDGYQSFHLAEPTAPVVNTATNPQIDASDRLSILDQRARFESAVRYRHGPVGLAHRRPKVELCR